MLGSELFSGSPYSVYHLPCCIFHAAAEPFTFSRPRVLGGAFHLGSWHASLDGGLRGSLPGRLSGGRLAR